MRNLLTLLLLIVLTISCEAQVVKRIKKGRRFKSESQFALDKNDFQAEWEIGRETIDSQLTTIIYPNLILHYALSDRLEVNTEMSLITAKNKSYSSKQNTTGIEPVLVGANYQVLRDNDNSPSVIVSAQLAIPFLSTKEFTINYFSPVLQISLQEALYEKWIFGLSGGLLWDGYSTSPNFTYNASTSYYYKKRWMVTAECFGFINDDMVQNNLDASLAYTINDLVQFGITAGTGISHFAPKNYFAVNGTWGFNTSKKSHGH
ncbi:transporter [Pinibacter soli]|uniref:Transporter n=1 Tax=Pinibacter soli TaxID=3044211 RepID=A0ABT6RE95_9BACT|nr:transporter [Pinibacter soli]MDI3320903.1 transporter [Pinibacter soli]